MEGFQVTNKKKALLVVLIALLVLCLIPLPLMRKDGGTKEFVAVLYRVIVWHQMNPDHHDYEADEVRSDEPEFLTGTNVYVFPFNFGDKEWKPSD